MSQTMHGQHIENSGPFDNDPTLPVVHCGGRGICKACSDEMNEWDRFSVDCRVCNGTRKYLVAGVCPNCKRDWSDIY